MLLACTRLGLRGNQGEGWVESVTADRVWKFRLGCLHITCKRPFTVQDRTWWGGHTLQGRTGWEGEGQKVGSGCGGFISILSQGPANVMSGSSFTPDGCLVWFSSLLS